MLRFCFSREGNTCSTGEGFSRNAERRRRNVEGVLFRPIPPVLDTSQPLGEPAVERMKRDPIFKHAAIAFVGALVLYAVAFKVIEHFRSVKGPWEVSFRTDSQGRPSIAISQGTLKIKDVSLVFPDDHLETSNRIKTIRFDAPKTNVPFGRVIFFDTTFLPGTLTFDLFGNEIELLPRVLVVNRKEVKWESGSSMALTASKQLEGKISP